MELGKEKRHMVDFLFVIALFFVFAISALLLVMIGANVYKKTVQDMSVNFNTRTSFAYITEKLRQNDTDNSVSIGKYKDLDAIILTDEYDELIYHTYLYLYDGSLRELFIEEGDDIDPSAGQIILDAKEFNVQSLTEDLYKITIVTTDDVDIPLLVNIHCN